MAINRSKRPQSSGDVNFKLPVILDFELNNRLNIYYCEKNDLPIVRINFLVNSGSKFDPVKFKGLSTLLTMTIDEGAGSLNAFQLSDEFEILGANFSVSSDPDISIITLQVLTENFIEALKLFSSVILKPHLNDDNFNLEKRKLLVRLEQVKAEPDYIADISYEHFLFGNQTAYSFPVLGLEQDIKNIQHQDVRHFYKEKFSPSNSSIVVVGNIDRDTIQQALNEVFGNWKNDSSTRIPEFNLQKFPKNIYIINKEDAVQTEIRIGHLTSKRNDKDFFQKQIMNLVFGGQFSSRLNLNLREKNGYTYGIHSSFSYFKEAGYFSVSTSVDSENTTNALKEIFSEITKIREGITEDELRFAQSSLTKKFPLNFETYRQISLNIRNKIFHSLPDDYYESYVDNINSISRDDVNKTAGDSIQPDALITVLVGDSKKILKQLVREEFGEVTSIGYDDIFIH